jgi:hypothetical protein
MVSGFDFRLDWLFGDFLGDGDPFSDFLKARAGFFRKI